MKKQNVLFVLCGALLLLTGCSAFREAFDESPQKREARIARRKARQAEESKRHRFNDPVHDMFKVNNDAPILPESSLSPYERQVLDAHRDMSRRDVEHFRREGERARKARQEWVFGKNPFD